MRGASVDGRRSGSGAPAALTRRRRERLLAPRAGRATGPLGVRQEASKVRSLVAHAVDNAAARARQRRRVPREGGTQGERSAAGRAPSSASSPGARKAARSTGRRLRGIDGTMSRDASEAVVTAKPVPLGSRTVHGCTCRGSVAEVGEKHLLHVWRFAARRVTSHGVARRGSSSSTRGASSHRVKGCRVSSART